MHPKYFNPITTSNPRESFYFKLALFTPSHYSNPAFKINDEEWRFIEDSNKLFFINLGYYGVAYRNEKQKEILISHEGTFIHNIIDVLDIFSCISYGLGLPPVIHLTLALSFTSAIAKDYPEYKITHTGVSLGGIIAQHELFNNHKVLAIESPGLENPVIAEQYTNFLSRVADVLAYTHLSFFAPLIPIAYYSAVGTLIYSNPIFFPVFFSAHHIHKLAKYFTNVQFEAPESCNLAVANGELHILTRWNDIKEAGVYYTLKGHDKITEPIIKFLSYLDAKIAIHDPGVLFNSMVVETKINELCSHQSEVIKGSNLNMVIETEVNALCNHQSGVLGGTNEEQTGI